MIAVAPTPLSKKDAEFARSLVIYIDDDVLEEFRDRADQAGSGYQTMMNQALREYLGKSIRPFDEKTLRRVIREELQAGR